MTHKEVLDNCLLISARTGDSKLFLLLLKEGANIDHENRWGGETPAQFIGGYGHLELAKILLQNQNIDAEDLIVPIAIYEENSNTLKFLEYLIEIEKVDIDSPPATDALEAALSNNNLVAAKFLIEKGVSFDLYEAYFESQRHLLNPEDSGINETEQYPQQGRVSAYLRDLIIKRGVDANA